MNYLSVKNYDEFQHYKDRAPPWIKFYNSVLDDYEFTRLPDAARFHLVAIWLLASRTANRIPNDEEWIRKAIKSTTEIDVQALISSGFLVDSEVLAKRKRTSSKMKAPRKQNACLEQSRAETEHITQQSRADRPPAALDSEKGKPVSKEAKAIAKRLAEMFGGDPESKQWHPSYVDVWLTEGITEDRIMTVAAEVAERGKDVNSIKYFVPVLSEGDDAPTAAGHQTTSPPAGFRNANQAEYTAYMKEKLGDPSFGQSHIKWSRWQWVPVDWNVTPLRKSV